MSNISNHGAMQKYNQVRAHAHTEGASAHRLIQLLMDGALEQMRVAKGLMERRDIPKKVHHINWALSIIDGLRQSLDMEKGGEIALNLNDLYDYMQRRLIVANLRNQPDILDEVISLLIEIKSAWDAIPEILKQEYENNSGQAGSDAMP